jgi:hypothetical protein
MKILSWDIGIKNLAYCLIDVPSDGSNPAVLEWKTICVECGGKFRDCLEKFIEHAYSQQWMYTEPNIVLIEFQLRSNPLMQQMAATVHATLKALSIAANHNLEIAYINSSTKFRTFGGVDSDDGATRSQKYKDTKNKAREIALFVLENWADSDGLNTFDDNDKSYDLADALGNAAAYMVRNKLWSAGN